MFNQRNWNNNATNQKKFNIEKKTKIKFTNDFIINEKPLNTKVSEKDKNNVQLILYRRVMNEFFENNYWN